MAFAVADRVKETSTTTGTGTLNLAGAEPGYQTFVAGVGTGNTTYYAIVNRATSEFEVGVGTVTDASPDTLSRDTIISSSNGGSAVNFSAGTKDVICTLPSEKSYVLDNAGDTTISADLSVTSISGSGAGLTGLNASNLASGTLPDSRFPATLPAASGANLTGLNASNLASGTIPDARFPATIPASSGANLTNLNASNVSSGTLSNDRLDTVPTTKGGTGLTTIGSANQVLAVNGGGTALEYQTISADITGVTAGNGLTGGGTTGDVTLNVGAGTGVTVNADDIAIGQDVATSASPTFAGATFTANVSLSDNDYLRLGTSQDLLIYHNGTNSIIRDAGTGDLRISGTNVYITNGADNEAKAYFGDNGPVELYYDNNKKFETTSGGISVTGTATATTFSGSGASLTNIPNAALDNSSITINGTTIALGSSGDIVAGTEWQAVTSTNVTATASQGIFMNSTGGPKTVTLPSSPTIGDEVSVIDYAGTSETNNITIGRNGSNIQGSATDFTLATNRGSVTFVYSDGTQGWLIRDRMSGWGG